MFKRIVIISAVILLVVILGVELYSPRVIKQFVGREVENIGITDFEMELTSSRPYLLSLIRNDLSGTITVEEYNSVITFDRIEANFTGYGLNQGSISFTGLVSESELNKLIKAQWGKELSIVLTKGHANLTMPINLYIVQIDASIKGVFNVKDNNEVVYDVKSIDISVPGFERNVEEFIINRGFRLSLDNIPNIQIDEIQIEEGYLVIYGLIQ